MKFGVLQSSLKALLSTSLEKEAVTSLSDLTDLRGQPQGPKGWLSPKKKIKGGKNTPTPSLRQNWNLEDRNLLK